MADTLVVIRSGATDYELQGRIRGTLEVPLCEQGIEEAHQFADELLKTPLEVLATSADAAAEETARILGRRWKREPKRIAGLENLDLGLWQGLEADDIRRRQPRLHRLWQSNPWNVAPPEGETLDDACRRVEAALERFLRKHTAGRVALVLPNPLDRVVRWMTMGQPLGDLWRCAVDESGIITIPLTEQWESREERSRHHLPTGVRKSLPV